MLAALLGVGVHVLRALPGLVADHADGLAAPAAADRAEDRRDQLLVFASVYTALVLVALLVVGQQRRPRPVTWPVSAAGDGCPRRHRREADRLAAAGDR